MRSILILTETPFRTDTNSGKTLSTMFQDITPNVLAQLYFNPQTPNIKMCHTFYSVHEKQLLASCFGLRRQVCGGEVAPQTETYHPPETNPIRFTKKKDKIPILFLREGLWSLSHWKNNTLKKWTDKVAPSCIFTILSDKPQTAKTACWLAKRYHCPIIIFVTDDYYHDPFNSNDPLRKLYFFMRQHAIAKMFRSASHMIGCSEAASAYFEKKFEIPATTVFTPSGKEYFQLPLHSQEQGAPLRLRFFGNVSLERWKVLRKLGQVLQELNNNGTNAILEVYSNVEDPEILQSLQIENGCVFKGWVSGASYLELLQSADIAVHVESFSEAMIRRTWMSVSTKIADYLGAGKCILAVGPRNVASIQHLEKAAFVISDLQSLKLKMQELLMDSEGRAHLQCQARALALAEHNIERIPSQVKNLIKYVEKEPN